MLQQAGQLLHLMRAGLPRKGRRKSKREQEKEPGERSYLNFAEDSPSILMLMKQP